LIRVVEHHDWVIYCIIGIILSYIIIFKTLHRDVTLIEFILQPYEESNNNILSWVFTTILFSISFSVLFSQFIPIVPLFISQNLVFGDVTLNKFGFIFVSLLMFYGIKNIFVYLFYGSINQLERFGRYSFIAQKYFMVYSLVILVMSVFHYYLHIKTSNAFIYYSSIVFIAFIIKVLIYLFHPQQILPRQWYYKFLYICTLQILPILVLWKFWFL
jgi:hypothetical protein